MTQIWWGLALLLLYPKQADLFGVAISKIKILRLACNYMKWWDNRFMSQGLNGLPPDGEAGVEAFFTSRSRLARFISTARCVVNQSEIGRPLSIPLAWQVTGSNEGAQVDLVPKSESGNSHAFLLGVGLKSERASVSAAVSIMPLSMMVEITRVAYGIHTEQVESLRNEAGQVPEWIAIITRQSGYSRGPDVETFVAYQGELQLTPFQPSTPAQSVAV